MSLRAKLARWLTIPGVQYHTSAALFDGHSLLPTTHTENSFDLLRCNSVASPPGSLPNSTQGNIRHRLPRALGACLLQSGPIFFLKFWFLDYKAPASVCKKKKKKLAFWVDKLPRGLDPAKDHKLGFGPPSPGPSICVPSIVHTVFLYSRLCLHSEHFPH